MRKILYLISTMVYSPQAISYVVDEAYREGAELIVCFVINNRVPESVSSWLIYIGFMGDKPSGELKSAITGNYWQRARTQLEEIEEEANKRGVTCRSLLLEGDLVEEGARVAQQEGIDLIMLNRPERSHLFRLFFGPMKENLTQRVRCPVKVVDEEILEKEDDSPSGDPLT